MNGSGAGDPQVVVRTERLELRRFVFEDGPFVLQLLNEPSFLEHIGDKGVRNLKDARAYLATGPMASYDRFGFGLYVVSLKESGEPIGMCGLLQREQLEDPDVGFAFLPAYWRQGYAFEAARAVLDHGKNDLGLERIVAITSPQNRRSAVLLEKLGLRFARSLWLSEDDECHLFAPGAPETP